MLHALEIYKVSCHWVSEKVLYPRHYILYHAFKSFYYGYPHCTCAKSEAGLDHCKSYQCEPGAHRVAHYSLSSWPILVFVEAFSIACIDSVRMHAYTKVNFAGKLLQWNPILYRIPIVASCANIFTFTSTPWVDHESQIDGDRKLRSCTWIRERLYCYYMNGRIQWYVTNDVSLL